MQLKLLWVFGLGALVLSEVFFALFIPGLVPLLLGILLAYLAGTLILDIPLQTVFDWSWGPFNAVNLHLIKAPDLPKATFYQYVWERSQQQVDPNQTRDPNKQKWDHVTAWRGP
ncbi:MAG: hypothetical protein ACREN8_02635, partial [Candidatus Dormibacteraceae bacterium]